jgi:hypothetical protein
MSSSPKILRPSPRRPFNYSSAPNQPPSPLLSPSQPDETPSRTHSILNLTSSTLLGIYSPTSYQTDAEFDPPLTPWGTGAETPQMQAVQRASAMLGSPTSRRKTFSSPPPASSTSVVFSLALRSILLFGTGMGYGWLVRHLHDDRQVAPFQVEGIIKPRNDWRYLVFWGVAGVALGSLLPWVDTLFATDETETLEKSSVKEEDTVEEENSGIFGADWTPVVRSVGAFVGIAYAIVCSSLCSISVILTGVAQTSLGINNASLSHTRSRQPGLMVPHRPLDARLHPQHRRRHNRSRAPPRLKPRRDAFSRSIFSPESKLLLEPRTTVTTRSRK